MRTTISFFILLVSFLLLSSSPIQAECCAASNPICTGPFVCEGGELICTTSAECPREPSCFDSGQPCNSLKPCCEEGFACSPTTSTCLSTAAPTPGPEPRPIECALAHIGTGRGGQNWDVTYCVAADTIEDLQRVAQITGICRRGATRILGEFVNNCSCHDDDWYDNFFTAIGARALCCVAGLGRCPSAARTTQSVSGQFPTLFDPNTNRYYTCFTLQGIDRNVGIMEVQIKDTNGHQVCSVPRATVAPGNYSWWEYFDNTLETRYDISLPFYEDPTEQDRYDLTCSTVTGKRGINTAVGCIAVKPVEFTQDFLTVSIGIGGGIALLLLLYATALITLSQGNPQKIQSGQQIIAAVIQGLILITLSVVMLNFLGINILNLPGLQ